MKKPALVLLTVLALLPASALFAQAQPAAPPPAASTPAPLAAPFLAPLPSQVPPPLFLTDGCTSTSQCPTGQLCCWVCGNPPADEEISCRACVTPIKGRCPMVV